MSEDLILILAFVGFIVLQRWILPLFGIHTCMSPKGCGANRQDEADVAGKAVIKVKQIDLDSFKD